MYRLARVSPTVALAALAFAGIGFAEDKPETLSAESAFKTATDLMQKEQFNQAIPYLKRVQKDLPDNPAALWNLGIALVETGEHQKAAETWRSLRRVAPEDWRAISKLVQAYQALGDIKSRDAEIKALYQFRKSSLDPKVKDRERFCREQSDMAGQRVFAFEYFSPQGPWKKYFLFSIVDKKGIEQSNISLGSYDVTTEISRELGETSKDQRLYHLDAYQGSLHTTYAFFEEKPEYDRVRPMVVNILEGKLKPISGSKP
jgi:tetratricopeptide (TPR) repeat protein